MEQEKDAAPDLKEALDKAGERPAHLVVQGGYYPWNVVTGSGRACAWLFFLVTLVAFGLYASLIVYHASTQASHPQTSIVLDRTSTIPLPDVSLCFDPYVTFPLTTGQLDNVVVECKVAGLQAPGSLEPGTTSSTPQPVYFQNEFPYFGYAAAPYVATEANIVASWKEDQRSSNITLEAPNDKHGTWYLGLRYMSGEVMTFILSTAAGGALRILYCGNCSVAIIYPLDPRAVTVVVPTVTTEANFKLGENITASSGEAIYLSTSRGTRSERFVADIESEDSGVCSLSRYCGTVCPAWISGITVDPCIPSPPPRGSSPPTTLPNKYLPNSPPPPPAVQSSAGDPSNSRQFWPFTRNLYSVSPQSNCQNVTFAFQNAVAQSLTTGPRTVSQPCFSYHFGQLAVAQTSGFRVMLQFENLQSNQSQITVVHDEVPLQALVAVVYPAGGLSGFVSQFTAPIVDGVVSAVLSVSKRSPYRWTFFSSSKDDLWRYSPRISTASIQRGYEYLPVNATFTDRIIVDFSFNFDDGLTVIEEVNPWFAVLYSLGGAWSLVALVMSLALCSVGKNQPYLACIPYWARDSWKRVHKRSPRRVMRNSSKSRRNKLMLPEASLIDESA